MGCDIHPYFEVKDEDDKWERLTTRYDEIYAELYGRNSAIGDKLTQEERQKLQGEMWNHPLEIGRSYDLFAILADVRNGRGFAGVLTGTGFDPISEPRGIPDDVCQEIMEETSSDPDGHSHSWYTLKELLDYNWDAKTTIRRGIVSQSDYATWDRDKPGFPNEIASSVSGIFVEHIPEIEMQHRIEAGLPEEEEITKVINGKEMTGKSNFYCEINFKLRYSDCCRCFVDKTLPFLRDYADSSLGGDYTRLRFVFWFDN